MVTSKFYNNGEELQTIEGEGIIATAREGNLQAIAIVGTFSAEVFLQTIATMAVNAARAFFKTKSNTPADQLMINVMITKIKKEAEHSTVEKVTEEAEEIEE